jgi:hypothetical protein
LIEDLDALGWRVEASGGIIVSGDVNIDAVWRLPQGLNYGPGGFSFDDPGGLDVFVAIGGQAVSLGAAASTGPIVVFNLPSLEDYTGVFLSAAECVNDCETKWLKKLSSNG